jgi:hypothetical protein
MTLKTGQSGQRNLKEEVSYDADCEVKAQYMQPLKADDCAGGGREQWDGKELK